MSNPKDQHFSIITDFDTELFRSGKHFRMYEKLGSHLIDEADHQGTFFAVWAPNAKAVHLIGNFNGWNRTTHSMLPRWDGSGIWELFVPGIGQGEVYKYAVTSHTGKVFEKGDPYAFRWEEPPRTGSVVWPIDYEWQDQAWMDQRKDIGNNYSVYEIHLGSWRRQAHEGYRSLTYQEHATELVSYVKEMGFTHIELLPVMEHPYYGSWGYQLTGYFAPTSRYGDPQGFMALVEACHQAGIGVLLDWVPSHFPSDGHGLSYFDGTHLYEHEDPRQGYHPDWESLIYNYGRNEVRSFLISNALFWLDKYHIDGLRVDAVASMLYLDYSRDDGQWIPNKYGGKENLEAISFLKEFNETVYKEFPDAITIAEESTAFAGVSRPTYLGGLGFGQKWMMGWMNDALEYFQKNPIYRKFHQNNITFSWVYAFSENFMLPLSHDEVVHGKGSLLNKMPGDEWQRFANLRCLYGLMYMHPGTQLLFMGGEFGQYAEWNHEGSLHWHLLEHNYHRGIQSWIKDLNHLFKTSPALNASPFDPDSFEHIDFGDYENSVITFLRKLTTKDLEGNEEHKDQLVVCNFTPGFKENYRIGVPQKGEWVEVLNSDDEKYGGSGIVNEKVTSDPVPNHGRDHSIDIKLSPLSVMVFECAEPRLKKKTKKTPKKKAKKRK